MHRVVRAARAHHVGAQRTVRNLRRDIERESPFLQRAQVVREAFPLPANAFRQYCAGNVLDAFHQPDQPGPVLFANRRKSDAAIAHDHGGHAVQR
jgi:hypothetical protein